MRIDFLKSILVMLLVGLPGLVAAEESEIELLRAAIEELRSDYDARITDLERRLEMAEAGAPSSAVPASAISASNPAIGLIFTGNAWGYERSPEDWLVQGFPFGGEAGPIGEGLTLGETELNINANVDDKFAAWLTLALAIEDGEAVVEIEEAWVDATALPNGFGARFGRFFSNIGYLNSKHAHAWDFADQPLPYQAFLGGQLIDDGVQIRWLAPTDLYVELGAEALRGGQYPSSGAANDGLGSYSVFANFGGDIGSNSSWLAGMSYLDSRAVDRPSGAEDDPFLFSGDSTLTTAQFVWKWAPDGNWVKRNLVLQAEYLARREDGVYSGPGLAGSRYDVEQSGWYAQAVYQPIPRWRFGGRIDALSSDDPGPLFDGTVLQKADSNPRRFSLMADWANSEFSRFRLQLTRDEAGPVDETQWGIQYIHSIGAHGAHSF
jgi:hypothetical protein